MALEDLVTEPKTGLPLSGAWAGTVVTTAALVDDQVLVMLTSASAGRRTVGPCSWIPRDEIFPSAGDPCVVQFDDQGEPWIVCWRTA